MKFFKWNWMLIMSMVVIVGFVTMGILQKSNFKKDIAAKDAEIATLNGMVKTSEKNMRDAQDDAGKWMVKAKEREEKIAKGEARLAKSEKQRKYLKGRIARITPTEVVASTIAQIDCDGIRMFRLNGDASVVFSEDCARTNLESLEKFSLARSDIETLKGQKNDCLGEVADLKKAIASKDIVIGEKDSQIGSIRTIVQKTEDKVDLEIMNGKRKARKSFLTGTAIGAGIVLGISLLVGK